MTDKVVVTLKTEDFSRDYELPWSVNLGELYPRVLNALQETSGRVFRKYTGIVFELDGYGLLNRNASLSDYGVCTGFSLTVVPEKKYDGFGEIRNGGELKCRLKKRSIAD